MQSSEQPQLQIDDLVNLPDFPFRLTICQKGVIRFAEIENIEERFPTGFATMVYVPHLIYCGDLIIRNATFVRTPELMQWLEDAKQFRADSAEMVVTLLDEEGRDYYIWRFFNARPSSIIFEEQSLKESVVKVEYLSFTNDGHIREK